MTSLPPVRCFGGSHPGPGSVPRLGANIQRQLGIATQPIRTHASGQAPITGRGNASMGMTMAEKILARAGGLPEVKPGDVAVVDVETAVLMDMTFLPEGWREVLKVKDPKKVAIIFDHLVPAPTVQAASAQRIGRKFAAKFGIERLHDVGADQGIAHAVVADRAYAIPGTVLVNGDSHTCAAGAFNCAARGVGGPDMMYAITTGKAWFRVGETVRYDFTGKLRPGVSAKDIFLTIAGEHGAHVNQNIEYGGPGGAGLRVKTRRTPAPPGAQPVG